MDGEKVTGADNQQERLDTSKVSKILRDYTPELRKGVRYSPTLIAI